MNADFVRKHANKRKHHVVPEHYLSGFATFDHPRMIWEYTKGGQYKPGSKRGACNPAMISTGHAGMEKDYYASTDGGVVDFNKYENLLEQREKPADRALQQLRGQRSIITLDHRDRIADYIVMMFKRVPRRMRQFEMSMPELIEERRREWRLFIQDLLDMAVCTENPDTFRHNVRALWIAIERTLDRWAAEGVPDQVRLDSMLLHAPLIRQAIISMRWQYWQAPIGSFFITNDDPVFTVRSLGVDKPMSELVFPVSSRLCLVGSWQFGHVEGMVNVGHVEVHEINKRTASNATRYVYAREASEQVLNLLNDSEHVLNALYDPRTAYVPQHIRELSASLD